MASAWITFVKSYASKNKMKYNEALKDKGLKMAWEKEKAKGGSKKDSAPKTGKAPAKRMRKGRKAEEKDL